MTSVAAMQTLIELATRDTDAAAKRLGQAVRAADEAQQKLDLLTEYRNDYAARLQASMAAGLAASGFRNFQQFIGTLDGAISGQQAVVAAARQRITEARNDWQASERKRMSYGTLVERAHKEAQKETGKREQKQTDEHAARALLYKR